MSSDGPPQGLRGDRAALEFAPDDPDTVEQAASSAIDAGEDGEARVHLATLASTEARTRDSYVEEARLAALLGDVETATQALHELQERSPAAIPSHVWPQAMPLQQAPTGRQQGRASSRPSTARPGTVVPTPGTASPTSKQVISPLQALRTSKAKP